MALLQSFGTHLGYLRGYLAYSSQLTALVYIWEGAPAKNGAEAIKTQPRVSASVCITLLAVDQYVALQIWSNKIHNPLLCAGPHTSVNFQEEGCSIKCRVSHTIYSHLGLPSLPTILGSLPQSGQCRTTTPRISLIFWPILMVFFARPYILTVLSSTKYFWGHRKIKRMQWKPQVVLPSLCLSFVYMPINWVCRHL